MPNILEVVRELKFLQGKANAGQASASEIARIAELQKFMGGAKPTPPPAAPAAKPAPAPAPRPAAPPRPARAGEPEPDAGAFALSLDSDLLKELKTVAPGSEEGGSRLAATTHSAADDVDINNPFALKLDDPDFQEDPDESDAARTTFEVGEAVSAKATKENPFAMEVPDEVLGMDLAEDNQGGVTHELDERELAGNTHDAGDHRLGLEKNFEKALEKSDGSEVVAPVTQVKGTPMVPDSHYNAIRAGENAVVVQFRDGKIGKGTAGTFTPMAETFSLNQLLPAKPPIVVKLAECLTVRFIRDYTKASSAADAFPTKGLPAAGGVASGERVTVKLMDGESIVGTAMPHKEGESFFLIPAVNTGNVRRIWISAKAVRSKTKIA